MAQGSPINEILQMRQQGLSNNQIIQNLQRSGYTNTQVFDAMNQADTKMAVEGMKPGSLQQAPQTNQNVYNVPPVSSAPVSAVSHLSPQAEEVKNMIQADQVKVEELVEAIIEEKWVELVKDVNKIVDWKNRVEAQISDIEAQLNSLKDNFSDLNKAIISKVNDYDKHILEVGTDVKAMEKVFSKMLPGFTENVNELSKIANKLKGDSK